MAAGIPVRRRRGRTVQQPVQAVELPDPPRHLSREAQAMWTELTSEWVLAGDSLPLLRAGLENWDSYQLHRKAALKKPTITNKTTGSVRANPSHKMAIDALREFRMCFRALGLEPK